MITNSSTRRFVVDLFAGCGGLSLGLEDAGFEPVLVNEVNQDALDTYLVNRDARFPLLRRKYSSRDIRELTQDNCAQLTEMAKGFQSDYGFDYQAGELDLVVGGPPCQGYSGIGHRRNFAVDKKDLPSNHLFKEMVSVIKVLGPKIFLFENVRGILSGKWHSEGNKGEIWVDVKTAFDSIPGYRIESRLVHAKEFGVPQNRPRVLLVGIREDMDRKLRTHSKESVLIPTMAMQPPDLHELLSDLIDPEYRNGGQTKHYPSPPITEIQELLRSRPVTIGISPEPELTDHVYSKHSVAVKGKFKWLLNGGDPKHPDYRTKKFAQRVVPAVWDSNGPNITATSMPDDYIHYSQPRTLTVREWARLQMFPDWYRFEGKRTTGGQRRAGNPLTGEFERDLPKYTQIGNAVPVKMAYELGKHFQSILDRAEVRNPK